jgi:beta-xylosidase
MNLLENLIDQHGLADVLKAIAVICHEKAEHIQANWQDESLAEWWDKAAEAIYTISKGAPG